MTETFCESGWGLSLRERKGIVDWQMALGVNYLIPHAFYYSIGERRKKDSPPSEFYQAPFWPYYRVFADYTARITAMLTGGEPVARTAVLYPMASIWADFVPGDSGYAGVQAVEDAFAPLCKTLLELHRDYVILDEERFAQADVDGATFRVNDLAFDVLVVPPLTSLRSDTVAALRRVAGACPVVAVAPGEVRVLKTGPDDETCPLDLASIEGVQAVRDISGEALEEALRDVPADVVIDDAPAVYYLHRRREGRDVYFFANTGAETVATTASLAACGRAETWDAESGAIAATPGQRNVDGRLEAPLSLPPKGSALIVIDPAEPVAETPVVEFAPAQRIKVCDVWEFTPENGNFLALRHWDMRTHMNHKSTELRYTTTFVATEHVAGMRLILDGIPEHARGVPAVARSLMGHETEPQVLLNGKPETETLPWEVDPAFHVVALPGAGEHGTHTLEIVVRNHGWFPQPGLQEYVWLAGDFAVDCDGGAPLLTAARGIRPGAWEPQGFPCFSGTGAYYADVSLPGGVAGKRVFLEAGRVGDLMEVEVNGRDLGVRAWPPYRVEVSDVVRPGSNTVVIKVANSNRSFLEGADEGSPSGLLDDVWFEVGE